jgi:hypothetical protein
MTPIEDHACSTGVEKGIVTQVATMRGKEDDRGGEPPPSAAVRPDTQRHAGADRVRRRFWASLLGALASWTV